MRLLEDYSVAEVCGPCDEEMYRSQHVLMDVLFSCVSSFCLFSKDRITSAVIHQIYFCSESPFVNDVSLSLSVCVCV